MNAILDTHPAPAVAPTAGVGGPVLAPPAPTPPPAFPGASAAAVFALTRYPQLHRFYAAADAAGRARFEQVAARHAIVRLAREGQWAIAYEIAFQLEENIIDHYRDTGRLLGRAADGAAVAFAAAGLDPAAGEVGPKLLADLGDLFNELAAAMSAVRKRMSPVLRPLVDEPERVALALALAGREVGWQEVIK